MRPDIRSTTSRAVLAVMLTATAAMAFLASGCTTGTSKAAATPLALSLAATAGNAQVSLSWTAATGVKSYSLQRATVSTGMSAQIAAPAGTSYTDKSVKNGVTYFYSVSAVDENGQNVSSAQVAAKPVAPTAPTPPAAPGTPNPPSAPAPALLSAPTGLSAAGGDAQVALGWSTTANATKYHLKRATTSGGPYTQIVEASSTSFTDSGLTNGATYFYVVTAVDASSESGNSAQVSAKPAAAFELSAPANVSAKAGNAKVALSWSAANGASSYHVKRATTSGGSYTQIATASGTSYTDGGAKNGQTYYYVISSVDATAESGNSEEVGATPEPTAQTLELFGMSWSALQASHIPSVPFAGLRTWDTNTTWAQVETSQGNYDWSTLDVWLRMATAHNKDVMYTFGYVPHWASMRPSEACPYLSWDTGCAAPPSDVDSGDNLWKAYVTAVVQHSLSSPDLHIASYELWNEPDLQRTWSGTPAQLVTMARDAYAIIHKLNPNALVIGPAPSTATQFGVHFLPAYYAAGGATAQDVVGMHAYLYDGNQFSASPAGITSTISQLQLLMSQYGISNKPIWFTEGNWGDKNNVSMTGAQKVAYVGQEYVLMWASGAVQRYYWYSWDGQTFGTLWSASTGVQQAGTAYERIATWLVGSTHLAQPCAQGSDGTWTCNLVLASGYPAQIIWNPTATKTINVDASFVSTETLSNTTVYSIVGHQVAIGNVPVLIIGGQAVVNP
ncbi:MAG TPA: cellulase family glycosylhydrolase [Candidatus Dormibacteraeota bacterium]|nr:cellulase family glycosylhydrolase [Candidatus Dormibacteraeota bacterium]